MPQVSAKGWALYGHVFDDEQPAPKPLARYTVFLVDDQKTYQEAYGFAYTDETGYFLLSYSGTATGAGAQGKAASGAAPNLFVEIADTKAQPVYLSTTPSSAHSWHRDVSEHHHPRWKSADWRSAGSHSQSGNAELQGAEQIEASEDVLIETCMASAGCCWGIGSPSVTVPSLARAQLCSGMKTRRGVAVIGLGNWGSSLAAALDGAGLLLERVHARRRMFRSKLDAQVLWLCVPDAAIATTAEWLAAQRGDLSGQIVVHSSGALDRGVLAAAERAGARTGSVHPMMSFPTQACDRLEGNTLSAWKPRTPRRASSFSLWCDD